MPGQEAADHQAVGVLPVGELPLVFHWHVPAGEQRVRQVLLQVDKGVPAVQRRARRQVEPVLLLRLLLFHLLLLLPAPRGVSCAGFPAFCFRFPASSG